MAPVRDQIRQPRGALVALTVGITLSTLGCGFVSRMVDSAIYQTSLRWAASVVHPLLPGSWAGAKLIAVTLDPSTGNPPTRAWWAQTVLGNWPNDPPYPETGVVFALLAATVYAFIAVMAYWIQTRVETRKVRRWSIALLPSPMTTATYFAMVPLFLVIRESVARFWVFVSAHGVPIAWVQPRIAFVGATIFVVVLAAWACDSLFRRAFRSSRSVGPADHLAGDVACWRCGYRSGTIAPCPECGQLSPGVPDVFAVTRIGRWLSSSPRGRRWRRAAWALALLALLLLPLIVGTGQVILGIGVG